MPPRSLFPVFHDFCYQASGSGSLPRGPWLDTPEKRMAIGYGQVLLSGLGTDFLHSPLRQSMPILLRLFSHPQLSK